MAAVKIRRASFDWGEIYVDEHPNRSGEYDIYAERIRGTDIKFRTNTPAIRTAIIEDIKAIDAALERNEKIECTPITVTY